MDEKTINNSPEPLIYTPSTLTNSSNESNLYEQQNPPTNININLLSIPVEETQRSIKSAIISAALIEISSHFLFLPFIIKITEFSIFAILIYFVFISILCGYVGQHLYNKPYDSNRYLGGKAAALATLGIAPLFFIVIVFDIMLATSVNSDASEESMGYIFWAILIYLIIMGVVSLFGEFGAYLVSKKVSQKSSQ